MINLCVIHGGDLGHGVHDCKKCFGGMRLVTQQVLENCEEQKRGEKKNKIEMYMGFDSPAFILCFIKKANEQKKRLRARRGEVGNALSCLIRINLDTFPLHV